MPADRVILVTGGGGFIGNRFAEVIFLSRFARVRVGVRRWAGAARAARFPVDIVPCDVLDSRQVAEAMKGVHVVVHCAAGDDDVIVEGTRNVLEASAAAGVSRVIHLSTAEVYGPSVSGRVDETWPCEPSGAAYGDAKIAAERLVWQHSARGLPVTVFRPSIVYGPWSDQWTAALAQRLRSGRWGRYAGYGDGTCNLVYVDDLVAAALTSIHEERAVGQAFNVGGPDTLTWNEYFDRFNAVIGLPPLEVRSAQRARTTSLVTGTVRAAAHVVLDRYGDALMRFYERGGMAAIAMKRVKTWMNATPSSIELERLYSRHAVYDWAKAARVLGYRPAVNLDRGLGLSVDWLKYAGFLN
jgi:nucleoside-diphosphate-sugar epimerase